MSSSLRLLLGLFGALVIGSAFANTAPEKVRFASFDPKGDGKPLMLDGYWYRPISATRFPAIVMMHGCSGALTKKGAVAERFENMAQLLSGAGYGVLVVDSFTPRGQREICTTDRAKRSIKAEHRRFDAYGALIYLGNRPDVIPEKIGAIGFSHGATAALQIVDKSFSPYRQTEKRFAASVALYPGCSDTLNRKSVFMAYAPLLVLAGALDDWTPAAPCERLIKEARERGAPTEIVVYPGAYHSFDSGSPVKVRADVWGGKKPMHVGGNPEARADAYRRIPEFFSRYLNSATTHQ